MLWTVVVAFVREVLLMVLELLLVWVGGFLMVWCLLELRVLMLIRERMLFDFDFEFDLSCFRLVRLTIEVVVVVEVSWWCLLVLLKMWLVLLVRRLLRLIVIGIRVELRVCLKK